MSVKSGQLSSCSPLRFLLGILLVLLALPVSLYGDNLEEKRADLGAVVDHVEAYYKSLKD